MTLVIDPLPIIEVRGRQIPGWTSFDLSIDMLQPADSLTFSVPPSQWADIQKHDSVTVRFGRTGNVQFSGYVAGKTPASDNDEITVTCWDNVKRLVDTTVGQRAGYNIGRGSLKTEIERIVRPVFHTVVFDNASDRLLRRNTKKGIARTGREPLSGAELKAIERVVNGNTKRWSALSNLLDALGYLAWSSADGKSLIVSVPNYAQRSQYHFRHGIADSNVLSMDYNDTLEGRYSRIDVSGPIRKKKRRRAKKKTKARTVGRSIGSAVDPTTDFQFPHELLVKESTNNPGVAEKRADRLMGEQLGNARAVSLSVAGYGQVVNRGQVIYAPDTIATVTRELSDFRHRRVIKILDHASYYITAVRFSESQTGGAATEISLVPHGTPLV